MEIENNSNDNKAKNENGNLNENENLHKLNEVIPEFIDFKFEEEDWQNVPLIIKSTFQNLSSKMNLISNFIEQNFNFSNFKDLKERTEYTKQSLLPNPSNLPENQISISPIILLENEKDNHKEKERKNEQEKDKDKEKMKQNFPTVSSIIQGIHLQINNNESEIKKIKDTVSIVPKIEILEDQFLIFKV